MSNYCIEVLSVLSKIKRFPPVSMWYNYDENCFRISCSPSFEDIEGVGDTIEAAIQDLVCKLKDYLTDNEWNELENLRERNNYGESGN